MSERGKEGRKAREIWRQGWGWSMARLPPRHKIVGVRDGLFWPVGQHLLRRLLLLVGRYALVPEQLLVPATRKEMRQHSLGVLGS